MWVVTRAINEYNQDGDYFVCVFDHKPTFKELKSVLVYESDKVIDRLTKGGGRQDTEQEWFYLKELKNGELYKRS